MLQQAKISLFLVFVACAGLGLVSGDLDLDFCDPDFIIADPENLQIPLPTPTSQFEQLVELNSNGHTEEIIEIFDGKRNIGITARTNATSARTYYAIYDTDELLELKENYECKVSKLSTSDPSILPFLPIKYPNGTLHITLTFADLIQQGFLKIKYIGSSQDIRGIPVNEWQGCLASGSGDQLTTNRVTISYSDPKKWLPSQYAEDFKVVPVQIRIDTKLHATGEITQTVGAITRFKPYIDLKNPFTSSYVTPSGYFCPGRQNLKQLPHIPRAFSTVNQIAKSFVESKDLIGIIDHLAEEYDYNHKLFRFDSVNLTEVHDFSTGLNYQVDKRTEVCKIDVLKASFDSQVVEGGTKLEMRNPAAFFGAEDTEYHYVGQKFQNGLLCDVWVGKKLYQGVETVFEWYFMADDWVAIQGGRTTHLPVLTLVYQSVKNPQNPNQMLLEKTYNHWFLFSTQLVNILTFEIARCNRDISRQGFLFTIPSSYRDTIRNHSLSFIQGTILAIQKVARVVILRVADVAFEFGPGHVFVEFVIYDRSAKYGNVETPTDDVILEDATNNLIDHFNKNGLEITFPTSDRQNITIISDKKINRISKSSDSKFVVSIDGVYQGYDGGAVACFVIMTVLVGITVGFMLIVLHKRKTINLPFLRLFFSD